MSSKLVFGHLKPKDSIALNIIMLALSYNWLGVHVGNGPFIWCSSLERTVPDHFATRKTAWKGAIHAFLNQIIVVVDCCFIFLEAYSIQTMQCDHCMLPMITFDWDHWQDTEQQKTIFLYETLESLHVRFDRSVGLSLAQHIFNHWLWPKKELLSCTCTVNRVKSKK